MNSMKQKISYRVHWTTSWAYAIRTHIHTRLESGAGTLAHVQAWECSEEKLTYIFWLIYSAFSVYCTGHHPSISSLTHLQLQYAGTLTDWLTDLLGIPHSPIHVRLITFVLFGFNEIFNSILITFCVCECVFFTIFFSSYFVILSRHTRIQFQTPKMTHFQFVKRIT